MTGRLFYIIRHGETDYNKLGIVQGSGVDMPLNERGEKQARMFYDYYRNIHFKRIYTSALIRTQQSVLPFIEAGVPYQPNAALNEICWGVFEGKPQSKEEREEYHRVVQSWNNGDYQAKIRAGESAEELQARQRPFINYLLHGSNEECVLIAMHGRAMKSFLCTLLNLPLSEMEQFSHSNLCLYVVEYDGKECRLLRSNDITHLFS